MKKQRLLFIFLSAVLLLCWSVILSLSKDSQAATVSLPATGQVKCYDSSGAEITCTGTGQDRDKKMGVAWPSPRFAVSGDCVTDNLTGLVWTKNANLPNAAKTWQEALDYVATLNAGGGLCGQTDWRLPQILELESLVHEGYNNETCGASACSSNGAWLNTQGFINAQSHYYWSSSTDASYTIFTWVVNMYFGSVYVGNKTTSSDYVWPVRGGQTNAPAVVWKTGQTKCYDTSGAAIACAGTGQDGDKQEGVAWPTPRFADNGNGTVTDNLTGLIWLKNANCFSTKTWQDALTAANGLANSQCGLSDGSQAGDWRLPNRKELLSLVDYSNFGPTLAEGHPFTNAQSDVYWSSSTVAYGSYVAWGVSMGSGGVGDVAKTDSHYYVWPVRGRQSGSLCNLAISPSSQTFTSTGGTGTVTVTASDSACAWTASSSLSWATITSGSSGTGSGTVTILVAANTSTSSRTGTIDIDGQTFTITQSAASQNNCTATLSDSFLLHEPYFTISGFSLLSLSLDLQYAQDAQFPSTYVMFKVSNIGGVANPSVYSSCQASALSVKDSKYVLRIPILILGGTSYWFDLTYVPTTDGLLWFKLTDFGRN